MAAVSIGIFNAFIITELFLAVIMRVLLFVKFLGCSFVRSARYLNLHGST